MFWIVRPGAGHRQGEASSPGPPPARFADEVVASWSPNRSSAQRSPPPGPCVVPSTWRSRAPGVPIARLACDGQCLALRQPDIGNSLRPMASAGSGIRGSLSIGRCMIPADIICIPRCLGSFTESVARRQLGWLSTIKIGGAKPLGTLRAVAGPDACNVCEDPDVYWGA